MELVWIYNHRDPANVWPVWMKPPRRSSCVLLTSWQLPENHFLPELQHGLPSVGKACYLENALEMLTQAGEWYLDRQSGVLSYWPRTGEDLTQAEVVAPVVQKTLLAVTGTRERPVRNLHFKGIHVEYVDYPLPAAGHFGGWDLPTVGLHTQAEVCKIQSGSIRRCVLNMRAPAVSVMAG